MLLYVLICYIMNIVFLYYYVDVLFTCFALLRYCSDVEIVENAFVILQEGTVGVPPRVALCLTKA